MNIDPAAIRPALKAIILALLPGLEEETSDDFEATLRIVNKFRNRVRSSDKQYENDGDADSGNQYFWQCLFLASITNPSRRLGVLAYLNRHLPKLGGNEHWYTIPNENGGDEIIASSAMAESVTEPEPGLLVRCFATGLADQQVLVQRNFLDLLVTHLPLHSSILQNRITPDDLEILVSSAAGVVIRRDMSLNRRLWTWILGPDSLNSGLDHDNAEPASVSAVQAADLVFDNETSKSRYFSQFGLKPLVNGLRHMISRDSIYPSERAKPLRISLSLMDRWEVAGFVVPSVFLPIMHSTRDYKKLASSKAQYEEVFRSASSFFDGVESSLIFSELISLLHVEQSAIKTRSNRAVEDLRLANFVVSNFNMREEEMLVVHMPYFLLALLIKIRALSEGASEPAYTDIRTNALRECFSIANQLLDQIPERAFTGGNDDSSNGETMLSDQESKDEDILHTIVDYYRRSKESLELPPSPFSPTQIGDFLIRESHSLVVSALEYDRFGSYFKDRAPIFTELLRKAPKSEKYRTGGLLEGLYEELLSTVKPSSNRLPFSTVSSIASVLTTLYSIHITEFYITYEQLCDTIPFLVQRLWEFLSPSSPKFHVEAVRCLWLLHSVTWQDHLIESSITSLMIEKTKPSKSLHVTTSDQAERFFVLWNHSNQLNIDFSAARTIQSVRNPSMDTNSKPLYQSSLLNRPLFIVLDLLFGATDGPSLLVKEWLQDLSSVHKYVIVIINCYYFFSLSLSYDACRGINFVT